MFPTVNNSHLLRILCSDHWLDIFDQTWKLDIPHSRPTESISTSGSICPFLFSIKTIWWWGWFLCPSRNRVAPNLVNKYLPIKGMGQSGTNRNKCKNSWPLALHKWAPEKCACFFPDNPITYYLWLLRFSILWVKTEKVAPVSIRNSTKWPATSIITQVKGCCWITRRHRDSWPQEEKNSIQGQRRGLIAQSFKV